MKTILVCFLSHLHLALQNAFEMAIWQRIAIKGNVSNTEFRPEMMSPKVGSSIVSVLEMKVFLGGNIQLNDKIEKKQQQPIDSEQWNIN